MNAPIYALREDDGIVLWAREETLEAESPERTTSCELVHQQLSRLGVERAAHERAVCRWLLAAKRLGVHRLTELGSLEAYAQKMVGLTSRQLEERLRVGRRLPELPALDAALAAGDICFSAARELSRVATRDTEAEWLAWAESRPMSQIQRAVARRLLGDGPDDPGDPEREHHRLAFEVRAETLALFRDLQAAVRADLGGDVDDDTLLYEIARRALGGPQDDGRASYQVAVTRCAECGESSIDAGGDAHAVDDAIAEMAACDSQEIAGRLDAPSPHEQSPHVGARAAQKTPPAVRRQVLRRDRKCCVVPGCRNHRFLDVHHVVPRAEGGGHAPDGLVALCGAHHRAAHRGVLVVEGSAGGGLTFRRGDGTRFAEPFRPAAVSVAQQAFVALRQLGFKETQARALVDAVLRAGPPAGGEWKGASEELAAFIQAALRAS